jgi:O-antigen ligase
LRYFCFVMKAKNTIPTPPVPAAPPAGYGIFLWLAIFANSLFLVWQCLDRYLAPRFLFLSAALLISLALLWKDLKKNADWRFHTFDLLLIGWYGLNLAAVSWAFSWSEGIFYAQKTLLLFSVYWLFRQTLYRHEAAVVKTFSTITLWLTWIVCGIILVQIGMGFEQNGLDNEAMYAYASGVFGNKSLASDFLFFLLIFNVWTIKNAPKKGVFIFNTALLALLILVLQTRTVYLAVAAAVLIYSVTAGISDPAIRPFFTKRILPAGGFIVLVIAGLLTLRSDGSSLGERLNPLTYLESATANERRFVWYKTDLLNKDHYWWGVGNGSWKLWLPSKTLEGAYRLQEKGIVFTRAHNDYLEVRAEMGIMGAIWFIALFAAAGLALGMRLRKSGKSQHEMAVIGAGILGYCIIQYFDFPRERIEMQVILGLLLAFAVHYSRAFWTKSPGISLPAISTPFMAALVLGMAFNMVIGWNRVVGEIHNVNMLKAYQKNDFKTVLREAKAARNTFYEYNDVALPLQWYEGTAWYRTNNDEAALKSFGEALALNPWSFQVLNNYATALAKLEKYPEAIPYFEKAVEINPKYDEGKFNLAFSYTQLGEYQHALDWLAKVDTIANPKNEDDVKKNKGLLDNKANFLKSIEEKMK